MDGSAGAGRESAIRGWFRAAALPALAAVATAAAVGIAAAAAPGATAPPPADATAAQVLEAVRSAHGSVVLVNVWATWCDPCRHEFPALLKARRDLGPRGFTLILVSADFPDQRAKVRRFLGEQGVTFATYLKAENDMKFIDALDPHWSGALPVSFLYDRSGRLREFWEGETTYQALAGKIRALLAGPPKDRVSQGGSR